MKVLVMNCSPVRNGATAGYVVALRTGASMRECQHIFESIEHFYEHLEIECCDRLGLCSVEYKNAVEQRKDEIIEFCNKISN